MRRSIDDGRFSAWTFVAPVILVVAIVIVVGVARPIFSDVRGEASSTSSTSTTPSRARVTVQVQPVGSSSVAAKKGKRWDTVRAGDTLGQIAARNGTTVERLRKLNPTLDPQALQLNERVRVRR